MQAMEIGDMPWRSLVGGHGDSGLEARELVGSHGDSWEAREIAVGNQWRELV